MNDFGSFVEDFLDDSEDFCDNILGLMRKLQITHPTVLSHPHTARYLYGAAANAMLERSSDVNVNDKWNLVQTLLRSAIFLEKGHSILGLPPEEREQVRDRMSHVRWHFVKHCESIRDMVIYTDKKIPCKCLACIKRQVPEEPEMRTCATCCVEIANTMWCPKCLMCEYCSEECQLADWPRHQIQCKVFRGRINMEEANQRWFQRQASMGIID
ncbi:expressed unknown protein [Seminavis robusta]|uniref:MYND-type domain-containing protein n=1 Tax=Seminavis robusta TaxID=568900 RepID=A0A9N8H279_9STRA|nr:expressed unknown protein [Seminavis robusta]|eukprot:Sro5_g004100.1 n/a (213) ;mRNA; r:57313-57951